MYVGLGSNLGDRRAQLQRALAELSGPEVTITRVSPVYQSDPVGPVLVQPPFLNAVAEVDSKLNPVAFLDHCLTVEQHMGRRRVVAQGPRTIDIDLLLAGSAVGRWPGLDLPHPRLTERAFVLAPLLALAPELHDPRDGKPLSEHLSRVAKTQRLSRCAAPIELRPPPRHRRHP